MRKLLPVSIISLLVVIFFRNLFFHGFLPIPSDALVGLYHPFRDVFAMQFPRGIPFKNFLITDPIRQQYPWRELTISLEKQLQLPLWNPYSFSGYPLLANFQSGAFYPANIFFFFLPFSTGWTLLIFLQPLLAATFMYMYMRNLKVSIFAALLSGVAFAFSGFSVSWLEWGTILQTLMWVPLILLAKDKLILKWTKRWMMVFLFAEISSFLAGHLQIWFYAICLTNVYLFLRVFQKTKLQDSKNFFFQYQKNYLPFLLIGITMYVVTAIQWIPTLKFIFLSARTIDQNYLTQAGWFVPYQHLIQFVAPDFFGNPTTLNYWGVWNYGELVGYVGILPLIFALFAISARHDKKTYFYTIFLLLTLLFALPTPIAAIPYVLHLPFLSTSQPTRLMGIIDFALAVLAGLGFDYFMKAKSKIIFGILGLMGVMLLSFWLVALKLYVVFAISSENAHIIKQNLLFPTAIFLISTASICTFFLFQKKKVSIFICTVLLVIACFDLLRFADKFTPFTPKTYLYPSSRVLTYLQKNLGNSRFMTADSRILPPNVSDIYKIQSIEGYDPLYIETYAAFIAAMQRNKPDISGPFGFNRIITPHTYQTPLINLLGVKYVLSFEDIETIGYKKVLQEGQIKVYENKNALPRVFFVSHLIAVSSNHDSINQIFTNKNKLATTAIISRLTNMPTIVSGDAHIESYMPNTIVIHAVTSSTAFLVLTDIYYPTWHAYIDGKETEIYPTDYTFRGIFIPKGNHTIEFRDQWF